MFSFSLSFSKPRLISIVLLLAILVISLFFSSYSEGMEENDAVKTVNEDAPKANSSVVANAPLVGKPPLTSDSVKPSDAISLGTLSVSDITGALQNNPGVQKMINNKL
jgi:hypothetical protein